MITDIPKVLPLIEDNVKLNGLDPKQRCALDLQVDVCRARSFCGSMELACGLCVACGAKLVIPENYNHMLNLWL